MSIVIEHNGQRIEFPDEAAANAYFSTRPPRQAMLDRVASAKAGTLEVSPETLERQKEIDAMGQPPIPLAARINDFGPDLGTPIRAGTAAIARGMADIPALPVNIAQMGLLGYEKATGADRPTRASEFLAGLPDTRGMLASVPVIGPESQYEMPGTPGEYIATAGEFAGGAGMFGGAGQMLRYGVIPGLASETAGQATAGTKAEPYARASAALGASLMASPKPGAFRGGDESSRMANRLQDAGVRNITNGQARGSQPLMRLEGRLAPTSAQIDDYTSATMRQMGSGDNFATPTALFKVEKKIVDEMDRATSGVSIVPNASVAQRAMAVADTYAKNVPEVSLNPRIKGIGREIRALAVSRKPVSASLLKTWRSNVGKLSTSPDAPTREAAHAIRTVIDDLTDDALKAAGRTDDITKLALARENYRNFVGVRDAASRSGAEGGTLSPTTLNQSTIRSQGREAYATGRTTPMSEFTRAGAATLRPAPTVNPGGQRTISESLPAAMAATMGAGAYGAGMGPAGIATMAAAGAFGPALSQSAMRSNLVQTLMRDPARAATQTAPTWPGILSEFGNY